MRNFFLQMKDCKQTIAQKRDRKAAGVYSSVEAFLRSGNYSTYKKANLMVSMFLDGVPAAKIGARLNMSEGSVKNRLRSMISTELFALFGEDFFQNLAAYSESEENKQAVDISMKRVSCAGVSVIDYLLSDLVSYIGSSDDVKSFNMCDCAKEMDLLCDFSVSAFQKKAKACDLEKLKYLLGVLEGTKGTSKDWAELVDWLGFNMEGIRNG